MKAISRMDAEPSSWRTARVVRLWSGEWPAPALGRDPPVTHTPSAEGGAAPLCVPALSEWVF